MALCGYLTPLLKGECYAPQKPGLHPRNRHNGRYDLATLCQVTPELTQFLTLTPGGEQSVDFANPQAVKALNKALLAHFYAVKNWDIPDGFLCPPVPGRADYIHHLADLLGETSEHSGKCERAGRGSWGKLYLSADRRA